MSDGNLQFSSKVSPFRRNGHLRNENDEPTSPTRCAPKIRNKPSVANAAWKSKDGLHATEETGCHADTKVDKRRSSDGISES